MKIKLFLLSTFVFLFSCTGIDRKINRNDSLWILKIPENYEKSLVLDDCIENLTIIPLETNDSCLIGNIDQIIFKNNMYYIHDMDNKTLFIFNHKGEFVNRIHNIGKGPKEFLMIMDFKIDNDNNILILDYNKILKYDSIGHFKSQTKFNYTNSKLALSPHQFLTLPNEVFYFWRGSFAMEENKSNLHALYKANKKGEIIGEYFKIERDIKGWITRFYEYKKDHYYMQSITGNDTIYSLSEEGVNAAFKVDFGKNALPSDYLPKAFQIGQKLYEINTTTNYCTGINNILESSNLLYLSFISNNRIRHALYSKETKKIRTGTILFDLIPSSIGFRTVNSETNEFISIIDAYNLDLIFENKLKTTIKYLKNDSLILEKLKNRSDLSNPIIVVYKLNKF